MGTQITRDRKAALLDDRSHSNSNRTDSGAQVDAQDRLLQSNGVSYTYDDDGQLATRTVDGQTTTYTFDTLGQLRSVVLPTHRIDYVIDPAGRRVGKQVDGQLTKGFIYDAQGRVLAELDGSGNLVSQFAYGTHRNVPDLMMQGSAARTCRPSLPGVAMSRHVQFDFGLAKYDFLPILLMGLDSIIVILVWLLLRDLGWICLLLGGIVFFGLANAIRCAAGMRVTATENGLTIHRTGKFGEPLTLLYEDIGYVERILSSTCILVWTYQGQLLWIGPFQYFSGTKEHRRADSDNLRACAHIREGEVPADADIRQVPVKTRIQ